MIRAVLFDLYDTLLYSRGTGTRDRAMEVAAAAGIRREDWIGGWRATLAASLRGTIPTLLERVRAVLAQVAPPTADSSLADEMAGLLLAGETPCVYPDVRNGLAELHQRYRLGLVSNIERHQSHWIWELDLARHFDGIALSCEMGICKPERRIYLETADGLKARPAECVFVGDGANRELSGARAVGMTAVRIDRSQRDEDEERDDECDAVVTTLDELLAWLARMEEAAQGNTA